MSSGRLNLSPETALLIEAYALLRMCSVQFRLLEQGAALSGELQQELGAHLLDVQMHLRLPGRVAGTDQSDAAHPALRDRAVPTTEGQPS